jgi:hypothetical protein
VASKAANLPPVATLFAAFLGYNPVKTLLGPGINTAPPHQQQILLGHTFFPSVISHPFSSALASAFTFGMIACLIACAASLVPAKGQPIIARRRRRDAEQPSEEPGAAVPAGNQR